MEAGTGRGGKWDDEVLQVVRCDLKDWDQVTRALKCDRGQKNGVGTEDQ